MSQDESPFPLRFVLRLAALPVVFVIVAAVEGSKGCHCGSSSPASPPASEEAIRTVREAVDADDKARRDALATAKAQIFARPDLGACPVPFNTIAGKKSPLGGTTPTLSHYDVPRWSADGGGLLDRFPDELLAIESVGIAYDDEATVKPGPRKLRFDSDTKSGTITEASLGRFSGTTTYDTHDFELVIDKEVPGKVDNEESFTPGYLLGRFYVWSRLEKKIVCAAPIFSTNSDTLHFRNGESKLASLVASDLREQSLAQAKERLSVIGAEPGVPGDTEALTDAGAREGGTPHHGDAGARDGGGPHTAPRPRTSAQPKPDISIPF